MEENLLFFFLGCIHNSNTTQNQSIDQNKWIRDEAIIIANILIKNPRAAGGSNHLNVITWRSVGVSHPTHAEARSPRPSLDDTVQNSK
jgi:hypothetical protein